MSFPQMSWGIMKPFRVAVCLSGQPRTWRTALGNIKSFFDIQGAEVDYFLHAWNYNTWWREPNKYADGHDEILDDAELCDLWTAFSPKGFATSSKQKKHHMRFWYDLLYSFMRSIHLKRQYEQKHHFEYDLVIKSRYDVVFDPRTKFNNVSIKPMTAYSSNPVTKFPNEYYQNDFHDVMYWGDSLTMDLIGDTARYYRQQCHDRNDINQMAKAHWGPGVWLYRYMVSMGIHPNSTPMCSHVYTVVREEAQKCGLDPQVWGQYNQIRQIMMTKNVDNATEI
jgi:hypothetical protein